MIKRTRRKAKSSVGHKKSATRKAAVNRKPKKTAIKAAAAIRSVAFGQGIAGLSDPRSIEEFVEKAKATPRAETRELLFESGIYTRSGKLAKRFRVDKD